jgi:RNA polymerase sigma factor (sigma-70 family)
LTSRQDLKSKDDNFLINEYRSTDDKIYVGILFERYTHLIFGVCMKYLRDEDDAKDAVMMIFEKLMTDLKKHDIEFFRAWLHTVAKNHCLMKIRQTKRHVEFLDNKPVESAAEWHQDEKLELEKKLTLMESAIDKLDEQQRICINMFYLQEKSYQEITDHTGYDFNQVKSYIQNGKRNLKIYIQKNEK